MKSLSSSQYSKLHIGVIIFAVLSIVVLAVVAAYASNPSLFAGLQSYAKNNSKGTCNLRNGNNCSGSLKKEIDAAKQQKDAKRGIQTGVSSGNKNVRSVKYKNGYCVEHLDCNNSGKVPKGSQSCRSAVSGKNMNCCAPGQTRVFDANHDEPGTCQ